MPDARYDPVRSRYCCRKIVPTEDCGLLAFSQPHLAHAYAAAWLRGKGYSEVRPVTLDQGDLAVGRHVLVNSVILFDDPRDPVVHYVR